MVIRSLFGMVRIPETEIFSVRVDTYLVDREHEQVPKEWKGMDVYDSGDIIIETKDLIYRYTNVYDAYEVCAELIRHIGAGEKDLDLNEILTPALDDRIWGDFEVEIRKERK